MKKILALFFLSIFLVSCDTKKQLDIPKNLRFEDNIIYWDEISEATNYNVVIDGESFYTKDLFFDLGFLYSGEYKIKVCAISDTHKPSDYSTKISVKLTEIWIKDHQLRWLPLKDNKGYEVLINKEKHETTSLTMDLSLLVKNEQYLIEVVPKTLDSWNSNKITKKIIYDGSIGIPVLRSTKFQKNSEADLILNDIFENQELTNIEIYLNETKLLPDSFQYENGNLSFNNTYLKSLAPINHIFMIKSNLNGSLKSQALEIEIVEKPFIRSNNTVIFDETKDLVFEFELYGGYLEQISCTGLEETDYEISGSNLLIKAAFPKRLFDEKPDRKSIIIGFVLKENNNVVLGIIHIKRG